MNNAIVLFSGGLDSTTCLAIAKENHKKIIAVSFDYGQRHNVELIRARMIASDMNVEHIIVGIKMPIKSALTSKDIDVPKNRKFDGSIPITYVPGRNLIFISMGASIAQSNGIKNLYYGANMIDYSGYPDCREGFILSIENTIKEGLLMDDFKIHAPLLKMTKKEIYQKALELKVPIEKTWSCYDPIIIQDYGTVRYEPCGSCDSCRIRMAAMK